MLRHIQSNPQRRAPSGCSSMDFFSTGESSECFWLVEMVDVRSAFARDHVELYGPANALADGDPAQVRDQPRRWPLRHPGGMVQLRVRGRRDLLRIHRGPRWSAAAVSGRVDRLVAGRAGLAT